VNTGAATAPGDDVHVLTIDRVRFGDFEFDRLNRLLYRDGAELALPPRAVGVLSCLIDRPGQIVPKQVLLDEVWKDANVTETSLTEAVSLLRQALLDDPQRPTFIQTVPRRGYRFVATARPANGAASATATADESLPVAAAATLPESASRRATTAAGAATAVADSGPRVENAEWPAWLPWLFVVVMIGVMGGIILAVIRQPSSYARPVVRFSVELPAGIELARDGAALALSRDGHRVAFVARPADGSGAPRIYVRDADRVDPILLEHTDGASSPFFSPDGRWIGFFAGGMLKKVPSKGGIVVTLCEARVPLGAVWSTRRFIVFASSLTAGLSRVHEDGGTPVMLTTPDAASGEIRHVWPALLPNEAGVVFTGLPVGGGPAMARVAVLPFQTGRVETVVKGLSSPQVASTGQLLVTADRQIFAAPFDPETLEMLGQTVQIMADVATAVAADGNTVTQFAVAPGGHAAAIRMKHPEAAPAFRWVRPGDPGAPAPTFLSFHPPEIRWLSLSLDGARIAVERINVFSDVWVRTLDGELLFQSLTTDGLSIAPIWSPDGRRVIYASGQEGPFSLFSKTVGEAAAPVALLPVAPSAPVTSTASGSASASASSPTRQPGAAVHHTVPASAGADGLVYVDVNVNAQPRTGLDLWLLPWDGGAPQPLVRTAADETAGVISPDGRWLAYQSNASGAWTAMLAARPPATGAAVRIANTNGGRLAWSPDGRYVLFTRDDQLWQAPMKPEGLAGEPQLLASNVDAAGVLGVMPDGRVLIRTRAAWNGQTRLEVVLDWSRELNAKVPIKPRPARTVR
jgi:DNA-binding winged helix-turn-helix (wHTH) protein/dipeptidyl aminopeptidase/acylaminoacyl peptidase